MINRCSSTCHIFYNILWYLGWFHQKKVEITFMKIYDYKTYMILSGRGHLSELKYFMKDEVCDEILDLGSPDIVQWPKLPVWSKSKWAACVFWRPGNDDGDLFRGSINAGTKADIDNISDTCRPNGSSIKIGEDWKCHLVAWSRQRNTCEIFR